NGKGVGVCDYKVLKKPHTFLWEWGFVVVYVVISACDRHGCSVPTGASFFGRGHNGSVSPMFVQWKLWGQGLWFYFWVVHLFVQKSLCPKPKKTKPISRGYSSVCYFGILIFPVFPYFIVRLSPIDCILIQLFK